MGWIHPRESSLNIANNVYDLVHTNTRNLTNGNNVFVTDGGSSSTYNVQAQTSSTVSSNTSVTSSSNWGQYVDATGGAVAITLPSAASSTNKVFVIKKTDSSGNAVTVTRAGSDTIDGSNTYALSAQYDWVMIQSDGSTMWKIIGKTPPANSGAPAGAQYLTLALDGTLTAERVLVPGNNFTATDGGANGNYSIQNFVHTNVTTNTTLTTNSTTVQLGSSSGSTITITLPDVLTSANLDKVFMFKKIDASAGTIVIDASGSQTIDGQTTYTLANQYDFLIIQADTSSTSKEWRILGRNYPAGSFAPVDAQYITMTANSTLTAERVATSGLNVTVTDGTTTATFETGAYSSISSNTTLTTSSNMFQYVDASGGSVTVTLPTAAANGKMFVIKRTDNSVNTVTVQRAGSDLIDGQVSWTIPQFNALALQSVQLSAWWLH